MALFHRIKVTTTTTGTGAITLNATGVRDATNGDSLAPAEVAAAAGGQSISYWITSGNNFAHGNGSLSTNGMTLNRDPTERSWNGTTYTAGLLTLAGTSTILIAPSQADFGAGRRGRTLTLARGLYHL